MKTFRLHPWACATALTAALAAASGPSLAQKPAAAPKDKPSKAKLAAELAATLQACSYDGSPISFSPPDLSRGGDSGHQVVAEIMKYTGLPANFTVVEGQVPNAAAMIMLDAEKIPRRVITYNRSFMADVIQATKRNNWAPVSIMAHEIGHHLAGHTIVPGGSQPPIELESDKFSGFVLYKMGAPLNDAQKAIATLVPEQDGETHPGRRKRLAAIQDGWRQACTQQGRSDCDAGLPRTTEGGGAVASVPVPAPAPAAATRTAAAQPSPAAAAVAPIANPKGPNLASARMGQATGTVDVLPRPDAQALPTKGTQFVYDEFGVLDPQIRARYEKAMFEHARSTGVEIVTLLVRSLHGQSAQDYAWAMMRQLRIGKLDVGNGAVLVIAPEENAAAAAFGPGVALEIDPAGKRQQLESWLRAAWPECRRSGRCGQWTDNLLGAADHVRRDTRHWDWAIRYNSMAALQARAGVENGQSLSPQQSQVWRKLVRLSGQIESLDPARDGKGHLVNEFKLEGGRKAVMLRSEEGLSTMLYLDPAVENLMPGGKLQQGKRYTLVARESGVTWNPKGTHGLDLLSFNVID